MNEPVARSAPARGRRWMTTALTLALCLAPAVVRGQAAIDTSKLEDEAVARIGEYVRLNTTNPPGNEVQTMRFFARIFQQEGIPFDTAVSATGRGNIWARIKGGSKPALVLLHHMDVVPADRTLLGGRPVRCNGEERGDLRSRDARHQDTRHRRARDVSRAASLTCATRPRCHLHCDCGRRGGRDVRCWMGGPPTP